MKQLRILRVKLLRLFYKIFKREMFEKMEAMRLKNTEYLAFLMKEHALIVSKKSKLPNRQRALILKKVEILVAKGVLSYKNKPA